MFFGVILPSAMTFKIFSNLKLYPLQSRMLILFGVILSLQSYFGSVIFQVEGFNVMYIASAVWVLIGTYRVFLETKGKRAKLIYDNIAVAALMLSAIYMYGITGEFEGAYIACVLVSITLLVPGYDKLWLSYVFWGVLGAFYTGYSYVNFDGRVADYTAMSSEQWESYVLATNKSWGFMIVGLALILIASHMARNEYQAMATFEQRTKMISDRLNKIIAHNIRGPIATMQLQLEIDTYKGKDVSAYQELLNGLIHTTEDLFRFDADVQDISVNDLVKNLKNQYAGAIQVKLNVKDNFRIPQARGLYFAMHNFIGNSLKYSELPPVVSIIGSHKGWIFQVDDEGTGMDSSRLKRVGQKMESTSGMGVGLALSLEILSSFGFTVMFQSKEGLGTKVILGRDKSELKSYLNPNWPTKVLEAARGVPSPDQDLFDTI